MGPTVTISPGSNGSLFGDQVPPSASVILGLKQGETLYSVAHAYNVTVDNLRASNPFLNDAPLKAGDVLTIPR